MIKFKKLAHLMAGFSLLSACASVEVNRVTDYQQEGIRYWRPAPYLALQRITDKNKNSVCTFKVLTLPDKSEEYAITIKAGLGAAKVTPTLYEGWRLDSLSTEIDSKTAENLNAVANLIKSVAPEGLVTPSASRSTAARSSADGCSGIYRVNYGGDGRISGFTRMQLG